MHKYNIYIYIYIGCHHYCSSCTGTTNSITYCTCITGNPGIDPSDPISCFCKSEGFWEKPKADTIQFPNEYTCEPCHKFCVKCYGDSNIECNECNNITQEGIVHIDSSCLCATDNGYFVDVSGDCKPCHKYCKRCFGGLNTQCLECRFSVAIMFLVPDTCKCKGVGYYEDTSDALNPVCQGNL